MKIFEYIEIPEKIKKLKRICYITLAIVFIADFPIHHHHYFWFDEVPGFDAIYGLLCSVVIIIVAKWLGYNGIYQKEDYYD